MPEDFKRPIRSFVRRQGRLTRGQAQAYERYWKKFGLELQSGKLNFSQVFDRDAPTLLEIGFGMGEALLELAEQNPQLNYIGIDVHKPGIGAVFLGIEKKALSNIRLFNADAIDVLTQCIPDQSLNGIHLFFPDPWHKKRHHKRRIVNDSFAQLAHAKLKIDGYIHMATDWQNYAQQMLQVFTDTTGFINAAGKGQFSIRPESRPITRFEQRGQRLGHNVWDCLFIRSQ